MIKKVNNKKRTMKERTEKGSVNKMLNTFNNIIDDLEYDENLNEEHIRRIFPSNFNIYDVQDFLDTFPEPTKYNVVVNCVAKKFGWTVEETKDILADVFCYYEDSDKYDEEWDDLDDEDSDEYFEESVDINEARDAHTWGITYRDKSKRTKQHMVGASDAYDAKMKARKELGINFSDIDDIEMIENLDENTDNDATTTDKLVGILKSYLAMIKHSGRKYPEATLSDIEASIKSVLKKLGK